jgi:SAM-dependent methyltransferase
MSATDQLAMARSAGGPIRRHARISELDLSAFPYLTALTARQIAIWPDHEPTLATSLGNRTAEVMCDTEASSEMVTKIAEHHFGSVDKVCRDYQYFCQNMILEAELFFRRNGRYERSKFSEAVRDVYSKPDVMEKYMNGLLLSGVFWHNHAGALTFYRSEFLPMLPDGYRHLEIGPGHGALLHLTAIEGRAGSISGWDVSEGAIAATRRTLEVIGVSEDVELIRQDMFDAPDHFDTFDSIVVSELLEHLEDPLRALQSLIRYLKPGGRILVNMPANSPAPDHLYLIDKPEEMTDLMKAAGFIVEKNALFPMTGYDLARCLRDRLTIKCVAVGRRPLRLS